MLPWQPCFILFVLAALGQAVQEALEQALLRRELSSAEAAPAHLKKWDALKTPGCNTPAWGKLCTEKHEHYESILAEEAAARQSRFPQRAINVSSILHKLEAELSKLPADSREALHDFKSILHYSPFDVLAFRETWTEEDTEFLKSLDCHPNDFTDGELTTAKFAARLPSIQDLQDLLSSKSVAIVGNAPSRPGKGKEIDAHELVVRFNGHVGKTLNDDVGHKTDVHVFNRMTDGDEAVKTHFDLEMFMPYVSYCSHMRASSHFRRHRPHTLFFFRPSAQCGFPSPRLGVVDSESYFTRGFLFYWFVGSFFENAHLYNIVRPDEVKVATTHYDSGDIHSNGPTIETEPYLPFEHLFFQEVAKKGQLELTLVKE
jgi:hypothetical protein